MFGSIPSTADVLAKAFYHQHIQGFKRDAWKQALGYLQKLRLTREKLTAAHGLNGRRMIVGIFHNGDAETHVHLGQHTTSRLRDDTCKISRTLQMQGIAALFLAKANRHHLDEAAFNRARKICVQLDTVNRQHPVGLKGRFGEKIGMPLSVSPSGTVSIEASIGTPIVSSVMP